MNTSYALGLAFGIAFGLLVYAIYQKGSKGSKDYDERQLAAQGKAARAAMFAHLIYAAVCIACCNVFELRFLDLSGAMMLGICVSVGVFAVSCIWNDAYFTTSKSPRSSLLVFALLAGLQLFNLARSVRENGWLPGGTMDSIVVMSLGFLALMLSIIVTSLVKFAAEKRQEANDEES